MTIIGAPALCALLVAGVVASALAITPSGDFRCIVKDADQILVVSDLNTDRFILEDATGPVVATTLRVEKRFRNARGLRNGEDSEFTVLVRRNAWEGAGHQLSRNETSLVFIRDGDQGPEFIRGGVGVVRYHNGVAISGVKLSDQALSIFIHGSAKVHCPSDM